MSGETLIVMAVVVVLFGLAALVRMLIALVHAVTEQACPACQQRMSRRATECPTCGAAA